jgi:hypothetical protein
MNVFTRSNVFILIAFILMLIYTLIQGHILGATGSDVAWMPWGALSSFFLAGLVF